MENLLRHIRRRCLIVGAVSVLVFLAAIGILMTDSVSEQTPSWFDVAHAVCCSGGLAVLACSGWQLRQARKDQADDAGLLKKAEESCWVGVVACVIFGGWAVLDSLFFDPVRAGKAMGFCLGAMIVDSFCIAGTLTKVLHPQADAEPAE